MLTVRRQASHHHDTIAIDTVEQNLWLILPAAMRRPEASAQRITSTIMRETYPMFALWTAEVALGMWLVTLVFSLVSD